MNANEQRLAVWKMLELCEINRYSPIMVHSAFRRFAAVGFDIHTVLSALIDYAEKSVLLLPTMSWRFVNRSNPVFDVLKTPSNTGAMTEVFRTSFAQGRSLHPTHSVAGVGEDLDHFLGHHHLEITPCGSRSPFARLVESDGQILMMGIGIDCCTVIHHVEEIEEVDIYLNPSSKSVEYQCVDRDGQTRQVKVRHHYLMRRNYWQFQDMLHANGMLKVSRMGAPTCVGFSAKKLATLVRNRLIVDPRAILANDGQNYRMM